MCDKIIEWWNSLDISQATKAMKIIGVVIILIITPLIKNIVEWFKDKFIKGL